MLPGLSEQIAATEERYRTRQPEREAMAGKSILEANAPERMEKRLRRLSRAKAAVVAPLADESFAIFGTEPVNAGDPTIERIFQQNDLLAVRYLELGLRTARCVGRVRIRDGAGRTLGFGTGFLVAPRLMLTNNHVLESAQQAANSQIEFNFQESLDGDPPATTVFGLAPADLFITNKGLDFSLVAVAPRAVDGTAAESFGFTRLIEEEGKLVVKESVSIIQHPNGEPKQLAIRENRVVDILSNFVQYQTDTAPGSSGSPVLNDQWEVVALHHSGVPKRDANGNILAIDGSVWKPSMGDQRINWISNEGVRVSRILAHIKAQPITSVVAKQLRDTLFSTPGGEQQTATIPALKPMNGQSVSTVSLSSPVIRNDVATWTIPLQISVQVGASQGVPAAPAQTPQTSISNGSPEFPSPDDEENSEIRDALAAAREARTRPYYQEARDRQDRDQYYSGIGENLSRREMYERLNALLEETHTIRPRYKPAVHVYPFVDLQPNRKLQSIYSQEEFEPEELIRADFRILREITRQAREAMLTESLDLTQMKERITLLEASAQFNCEHVVPQSWFNQREPMRGDLHHLFACEPACNSFRSNTPYFDFSDFEEVIRGKCGKSDVALDGDRGFEPTGGKGTVARAVLYFLLRYPGEINNTGREFKANRLPVLLQWHNDFPPTIYERHRNQAIFAAQGNRNPLIDFPDWAEKIDFKLGLG
jgi:endonuclease G, mitochondrial